LLVLAAAIHRGLHGVVVDPAAQANVGAVVIEVLGGLCGQAVREGAGRSQIASEEKIPLHIETPAGSERGAHPKRAGTTLIGRAIPLAETGDFVVAGFHMTDREIRIETLREIAADLSANIEGVEA